MRSPVSPSTHTEPSADDENRCMTTTSNGAGFRCGVHRRRALLAVLATAACPSPALAAGQLEATLRVLPFADPIDQVAAGEGGALLAVGRDGALWRWHAADDRIRQLADSIDPASPLASADGRIVGLRVDGTLFVLDGDRAAPAGNLALAPQSGLLLLPDAIVGVEAASEGHRAVRFEAAGAASVWRPVARGPVGLLPDARPVRANIDGRRGAGQIALLAGPDAERYPHGVLGDAIEATRLGTLDDRLGLVRELALPHPHVFEDIAPRRVRRGDADALLTIVSGPAGSQLVLVGADPEARGAMVVLARGEPIGTRFRWLAPSTDGHHLLAVHTPHLGGVLHAYTQEGERLVGRRLTADVSNHRIGSRTLDIGTWTNGAVWLPDQARTHMRRFDAQRDWAETGGVTLPSAAQASVSLDAEGRYAVLLADGRVAVVESPR